MPKNQKVEPLDLKNDLNQVETRKTTKGEPFGEMKKMEKNVASRELFDISRFAKNIFKSS